MNWRVRRRRMIMGRKLLVLQTGRKQVGLYKLHPLYSLIIFLSSYSNLPTLLPWGPIRPPTPYLSFHPLLIPLLPTWLSLYSFPIPVLPSYPCTPFLSLYFLPIHLLPTYPSTPYLSLYSLPIPLHFTILLFLTYPPTPLLVLN